MGVKVKLNYFRKLKEEYLAKTPREKWALIRDINAFLLNLAGCNFVESGFKIRFRTIIPAYIVVQFFSLLLYTLYYYRNEPFRALQATCIIGIIVPGLLLYVLIVMPSTRNQYRRLYNFAGDFIYASSNLSPKIYEVCDKMAISLLTDSIKIFSLIFLANTFACLGALFKIFVKNEKELIIPVILPFNDPDTDKGFFINFLSLVPSCAIGVILIPATELLTCVLKNNVSVAAAIIENSLQEFGDSLKDRNLECSAEDSKRFRNIAIQIMDYNKFVDDLTKLYYWKFFLQPGLLMYSVVIGFSLYLLDNWIPGTGTAICVYIQLLILCDVGETVDDANNVILDALNQFPFYALPAKKQKMMVLLIKRMQNGSKIRMGPLTELNYVTATKLTKVTFNYLMVMLKTTK